MANSIEILGAVNNVLGLGSRIYIFFSNVKDAPEEVRRMCEQLQSLQKLLPEIERAAFDLVHAMPLSLETILTCLEGCDTDFNTLWLAVEPLRTEPGITWRDALNRITASVKWVVKTEELEKFTKNLETAKQTLVLAMLLAGMRVDRAVLNGLSSIDTKLEKYGCAINSRLDDVHREIAFQLKQSEYKFLKRIDILSGAAAEIHGQNNLRVTQLYDSITPNELLQTDHLSTVQSVGSDVTFAVSASRTPQIGLVDFSFENQQGDDADQAKKKDDETLDSLLPGFQDAIRRWEVVAYANGTHNSGNAALGSSNSPLSNIIYQLKEVEETVKQYDLAGGMFEKFENNSLLFNILELSAIANPGVELVLEVARRWTEYFELIKEALHEMQYALETCTREYELYPEPKLKIMIMELYTESFSGMTTVLKVLRGRWKLWVPGRNHHILKDTIAKIRRSSQKVIKEVEYLQRRELRQAHLRLRGIDRKQDQVIRALDEQKKILISMQEERKALNLINDHQKVVQMLQQLLAKFPLPVAVGASMSE
ncbi:uncharacterized protein Triagg1_1051 [Trichoderma aggressivum f. europaeum]|uniref:Fungal N-terminal domain-containing protein n=1 Tax=Trichoderma aggressivum f. europaeum TaxID=173218 RepID=A0AAE1JI11_9HYPO|nr:hypothetical protein Triagg1_1051 [Trichoderma aggressivum f. europaeum]